MYPRDEPRNENFVLLQWLLICDLFDKAHPRLGSSLTPCVFRAVEEGVGAGEFFFLS